MDKLSQREFAIVNDLAELLRKNGNILHSYLKPLL